MKAVSVIISGNSEISIGLAPGQKADPVREMAWLCEGLVLLIKSAHKAGIKDESLSMHDCMKHLKMGFVDPDYEVIK